jgi:hypothetical protein
MLGLKVRLDNPDHQVPGHASCKRVGDFVYVKAALLAFITMMEALIYYAVLCEARTMATVSSREEFKAVPVETVSSRV